MNEKTLSNDELTALAVPVSTQHLLSHFIRVLCEDGLVSQSQIRRAAERAMADLQAMPGPVHMRAALLLESLSVET